MTTQPDYSKMSSQDFDSTLESIVAHMTASSLLSIGDVYSTLAEELNNEVLEAWERANPHLAFPQDHPADHAEISGDANTGWFVETWSGSYKLTSEPFQHLTLAEQRLEELQTELESALCSAE